jgi:hypothetical protein
MRLRNAFAASVLVLTAACFAQAGVTSIEAVVVPQAVVPNTVTNDILIDFTGNLRGQQMILELTAGSIFQQATFGGDTAPNGALWAAFPDTQYDTFMTVGGLRSDGPVPPASQPILVVGGAVDLQPGAVKKFDTQGLNVAWAPGTGVDVPNGTDYPMARITLSNDAAGTLKFFSSTGAGTGDPLTVDFDIAAGVIGGIEEVVSVGDLSLVADTLNETVTGAVALENVTGLAFDAVNTPVFTPLIPGKTLALPNLPTLDNAGNFSWNTAGAKRGTYAWAITGTGTGGTDGGTITVEVQQIPEPATLALVGLVAVGCVSVARRRS